MKIPFTLGALATLLLCGGSGCNMKEMTVNMTAPVIQAASMAFNAEPDPTFARDAAPGQLKTADGFLASSPNNRDLLGVVARGYIEYSFGFLEADLEKIPDDPQHADERTALTGRATGLYDRALDYSLRLLNLDDKHFSEAFNKDVASAEAEAKKLDKKSAPGLLYAGLALASAINLNREDLARVVDLPKAIALIKRSYELDPTFYNSGAAMTLGVIDASQGKAIGGDPDQAKIYFDQAIKNTAGKYLMVKVLMARYYGVITQNRPLFESTLKSVIATPASVDPPYRLANELAKRRAARYLAHADDFF